ncbi:hypothetical protein PIB30_027554 [Stylosanthes scabra]|uniref:Uncharacterized protein n=1 Tax=Stylosanthes scabra TaxID=79078 RepID=A0ABU6V9L5_9FABA|nr:hypothetical protein [Stylosanthes scabra]
MSQLGSPLPDWRLSCSLILRVHHGLSKNRGYVVRSFSIAPSWSFALSSSLTAPLFADTPLHYAAVALTTPPSGSPLSLPSSLHRNLIVSPPLLQPQRPTLFLLFRAIPAAAAASSYLPIRFFHLFCLPASSSSSLCCCCGGVTIVMVVMVR